MIIGTGGTSHVKYPLCCSFPMSYYPDLSPYIYHARSQRANTLNVGWLDDQHPYAIGSVNTPVIERLWHFCASPVVRMRGYHTCELCSDASTPLVVSKGEQQLRLGASEIRVFAHDGTWYAAPDLIYHYIVAHQYMPPKDFVEAILHTPLPHTNSYKEQLRLNGF